jgi:predicted nucleic acid-binding protein
MTMSEAAAALAYILGLPVRLRALRQLAPTALGLALDCGLSVYDALYVVLARALDATLVTADRRLAEHHDRVALVA